jgi:hypothetical protein
MTARAAPPPAAPLTIFRTGAGGLDCCLRRAGPLVKNNDKPTRTDGMTATLHERLNRVVNSDFSGSPSAGRPLEEVKPDNSRDRLLCLLTIYDLTTAPLDQVGPKARWAGHPAIVAIKMRLEQEWLAELEDASSSQTEAADPVRAIRALAAKDRLPQVYQWVNEHADLPQLRQFLAVEGVAVACQRSPVQHADRSGHGSRIRPATDRRHQQRVGEDGSPGTCLTFPFAAVPTSGGKPTAGD